MDFNADSWNRWWKKIEHFTDVILTLLILTNYFTYRWTQMDFNFQSCCFSFVYVWWAIAIILRFYLPRGACIMKLFLSFYSSCRNYFFKLSSCFVWLSFIFILVKWICLVMILHTRYPKKNELTKIGSDWLMITKPWNKLLFHGISTIKYGICII